MSDALLAADNECPTLGDPILDGMVPLSQNDLQRLMSNPDLKDSYLINHYYGAGDSICYWYIDLAPAAECGLMAGVGDNASDTDVDSTTREPPGYMVDSLDLLETRVSEYPPILKALSRWTDGIGSLHQRLTANSTRAREIVVSTRSLDQKRSALDVLFQESGEISKKIAELARVNFDIMGGCGAGEEDSQEFEFKIRPKATYARYILEYNFDRCEGLIDHPYDSDECDYWEVMLPTHNYLSGNYRYNVIWADGTTRRDRFSANGVKKRVFGIEK
ncbi:hypothetical protein NKI04_26345 [Mesorhizobium sp. M0814]|uniref:hypothetical protein n=1 Tax=Mesorhizobium sp. M0814 TaxID=2957004 RepID=UPI0033358057